MRSHVVAKRCWRWFSCVVCCFRLARTVRWTRLPMSRSRNPFALSVAWAAPPSRRLRLARSRSANRRRIESVETPWSDASLSTICLTRSTGASPSRSSLSIAVSSGSRVPGGRYALKSKASGAPFACTTDTLGSAARCPTVEVAVSFGGVSLVSSGPRLAPCTLRTLLRPKEGVAHPSTSVAPAGEAAKVPRQASPKARAKRQGRKHA